MCFCCAHNMTFASGKGLFLHKEELVADLKGKSLLGLQGVTKENIELILRSARKMKDIVNSGDKKLPLLHGKIGSKHVLGTE